MTTLPAERRPRAYWPELSDLFTGFPSFARLLRLEDEMQEGHYVVRAEIPGIGPERDVDITVHDGRLTIKAERTEKAESKGRSEFSYWLPVGDNAAQVVNEPVTGQLRNRLERAGFLE